MQINSAAGLAAAGGNIRSESFAAIGCHSVSTPAMIRRPVNPLDT